MLVNRLWRLRHRNDEGAALVAVVVTMLVGFIAVTTIAASVVFTISANSGNKNRTQAFIAAESGRDAALANVMKVPCALGASNAVATNPPVYAAAATTGPNEGSLAAACPSLTSPSVIRIVSTGKGPDGTATELTSLFQRTVTYVGQPGGTMAFFSGQFKATQSSYIGDLVIRDGKYTCNSTTVIDGDLWVPRGGIELSADCTINGDIFAEGDVDIKSAKVTITGTISTRGSITVDSQNAEIIKDLKSSKDITVSKGVVGGKGFAHLTASDPGNRVVGGVQSNVNPDPAVSQADLDAVYVMTTWVDLPQEPAFWGSDVWWETGPCNGADVTGKVTAGLPTGYSRVGIDYRGCTGDVTIRLVGGATQFTHDAVFLVAPGSKMTVTTGNINSTGPVPQLFFVQGDSILGNSVPNCGAGMASGDLSLGSTLNANLMFYTPCGFKNTNQVAFDGQFYSNTDGSAHWVQPEFNCQPMEWLPMLDLSCEITIGTTSGGTSTPILGPPTMISQTEK
ncbi:hypothetical protein [Microbacterium sp. P5_E9]